MNDVDDSRGRPPPCLSSLPAPDVAVTPLPGASPARHAVDRPRLLCRRELLQAGAHTAHLHRCAAKQAPLSPGRLLTPCSPAVLRTDDLAVSEPLKSAYRRFKRLGKADKHGKVDAAGLARALRVKETPFLRKLLECWDRDGVRGLTLA